MSSVAVVADTTAYLPAELVRINNIELVSLYVNFGGERTVRESDLTDYDAFYEELRGSEALPTTSQPAVGDFLAVYEPLLDAGRDIVSIHISGGLSGTSEAARQAVEALERDGGREAGRVRVVDSATAAGGLGLMALAAARAAEHGADLDAVERAARETRENLGLWFAIDTLEYLKRGGRIGGASAWIGSTLKIKPILSVQSEMVPARARAHQRQGVRPHGPVRPRSGTPTRPTPGWCSTSSRRTRPRVWPTHAARCSATSRSGSARSGQCSECTPVRACWASAASHRACSRRAG